MHKFFTPRLLAIVAFIALFIFNSSAFATARSSTGSGGSWNATGSWALGVVPVAGDDVTIVTGATVNLNVSTVNLNSLTIQSGATLIVTVNASTLNIAGNIVNDGTLTTWVNETGPMSGDLVLAANSTWTGVGTWNLGNINIATFAWEFADNMIFNIARTITQGAGGKINFTNQRVNTIFLFNGGNVSSTIPPDGTNCFYPSITIKKPSGFDVRFGASAGLNNINLLGDINFFASTDVLFLRGNNTLTINRAVTGSGSFRGNTTGGFTTAPSIIVASTSTASNINMFTNAGIFLNLTINAGVTLNMSAASGTLGIINVLTINNATATIGTNITTLQIGNYTTPASSGTVTLVGTGLLSVSSTLNLNVYGDGTAGIGFASAGKTLNKFRIEKTSGTATLTTDATVGDSVSVRNAGNFTISTGATLNGTLTLSAAGNLAVNGNVSVSGILGFSSTGNLSLAAAKTLTLNAGVTKSSTGSISSATTGTVNYNQATSGQAVIDGTYGNLTFTSGAINKSLSTSTIFIAGTFTPGSGTYTGNSTLNFNGASQALPAFTYFNLTVSGTGSPTLSSNITVGNTFLLSGAANLALNADVIVTGALSITSTGNLAANGDMTVNGALGFTNTGSLTIAAAKTLTLNAGVTKSSSGTINSAATGTINYNQSSNGQAVINGTYSNLTFSNFNKTLSSAGNINISGTFTQGSGTPTVTGSTINFNGASQSIPLFTYNNLTVSGTGTATLSSNLTVGGALSLSGGGDFTVNADVTVTGALNHSGTGNLAANGNMTVNGALGFTNTGNLTLAAAKTLTLNAAITKSSTGTISSATTGTVNYNQSTSGQAVIDGIYGNLTFTSGAIDKSLSASNTIFIAGTFTPGSGTYTGNSTINFNGASQSIPLFTYYNLTISGTGTPTLSGNVTVSNVLNIASGTLTIGSNTLTVNGTIISTGQFIGSTASILTLSGTTQTASLNFDQTSTANHTLQALNINSSTTGTVTISSDLIIGNAGAGGLALTNSTSTILPVAAATITLDAPGSGSGTFAGNPAGSIIVTANSTLTSFKAAAGSSFLNLTIGKTGTVAFPTAFTIRNTLDLATGLAVPLPSSGTMTIGTGSNAGSITGGGTLTGSSTANLTIAGAGATSLNFTSGSALLNTFTISKTSASSPVTLGTDLTVNGAFSLSVSTARLAINGNNLTLVSTINSTGAFIGSSTSILTVGTSATVSINPSLVFDQTSTANHTLQTLSANTSGVSSNSITINSDLTIGTSLDISPSNNFIFPGTGSTITLNGALLGTGLFDGNGTSGSIVIGGSSLTTLRAVATSSFLNLTITRTAATVNIPNGITVRDSLYLGTGIILTLPNSLSNGLVMGSGGTRGIITGSGTISGNSTNTIQLVGTDPVALNFTNATTATLGNLTIGKSLATGIVTFNATTLNVNSTLVLSTANSRLSLAGGKSLISIGSTVTTTGKFIGSSTSNLTMNDDAATIPTLNFSQTSGENELNNLTINRIGTSKETDIPGTDALIINGTINIGANNNLSIGSGTLTLKGTITNGSTAYFTGSSTAQLVVSGSGPNPTIYLDPTNTSTSTLYNLSINRSGQTVAFGNSAFVVTNNLDIANGSTLTLPSTSLTVGTSGTAGIVQCNTTGVLTGGATTGTSKNLILDGTGAANLRFTSGSQNLAQFTNLKTAGDVTLNSALTVNSNFVLNNAGSNFNLNGNTLTLSGNTLTTTGKFIGSSTSNLIVNGAGTLIAASLNFSQSGSENVLNNLSIIRTAASGVNTVSVASGNTLNINGTLTIGTGSSPDNYFDLNTGGILKLNGNITSSAHGFFKGSSTAQLFIQGSGSSASVYFDPSSANNHTLSSMTINRSAGIGTTTTLGNALFIQALADIQSGTLVSGGNLTMLSTASSTSSIGTLTTGVSDVTGIVNVQSYFTGGSTASRTFRGITSPVVSTGNSFFTQLKSKMIITGTGNTANGFDLGNTTLPNSVTMQTYNEPALSTVSQYIPLPSLTGATTYAGQGFFFFFRGDNINNWGGSGSGTGSKLNAPFATPENVTVTYTGAINKGNISPPVTYTANGDSYDGYNLIGNPYPSTIDWNLVTTRTNITNKIIVLKPGGGFAQYSAGISSNVPGGTGTAMNIIQPGQAFYVIANGASPSITFTEACKLPAGAPVRLLSMPVDEVTAVNSSPSNHISNATPSQLLRFNLQNDVNTEETVIAFQNGRTANYDVNDDALFFGGTSVTLSSASADGKNLSINFMPDVSEVSAIKLYTNASASGNVKLNFSDLSGAGNTDVILQDAYLNTQTDVKANPVYNFNIDKTTAASYGANRFMLLFQPPVVLPLKLSSFTAKKANGGAEINWSTASEQNNDHFELERSIDGKVFEKIAQIKGAGNSSKKLNYTFMDSHPVNGINYYRLKQVDDDGKYSYSESISLDYTLFTSSSDKDLQILIYPNPAIDEIKVNLKTPVNGKVLMTVFDFAGNKIRSATFDDKQITSNISTLNAGIYIVEIRDIIKNKLIGKAKFIKN